MHAMRVLIQSTVTFLFLVDGDTATQNPDEARDFKHAAKALKFVKENRLTNVQIILKFPKTSDDVNLAILELLEREQRKPRTGTPRYIPNVASKNLYAADRK